MSVGEMWCRNGLLWIELSPWIVSFFDAFLILMEMEVAVQYLEYMGRILFLLMIKPQKFCTQHPKEANLYDIISR